MSEVKRYEPDYDVTGFNGMAEDGDGAYVLYADYATLEADRDTLRAERSNLLDIVAGVAAATKRDQNKESVVQSVERVCAENAKLRGLLDYIGGVLERGEDQIDLPDAINAARSARAV